jgi:hypothetical protein
MNVFCLLWTPLFYFFWVSLMPSKTNGPAGAAALFLGSVFALSRFITGPWVSPGEFGFCRWLSALVDTAGLPALVPFLFFVFFAALKIIPPSGDSAGFALLWLIPEGIFRSLSRAGRHDAVFLALVPMLWTALALGIPFFARFIPGGNLRPRTILAASGIAALPAAAVTCYWAFFCQRLLWGWLFFALTLIPPVFSIGLALYQVRKQKPAAP